MFLNNRQRKEENFGEKKKVSGRKKLVEKANLAWCTRHGVLMRRQA